jgi:hypothetical protein
MANPFTVQPLGGFQGVQNITQGMQSIARRSEMNDQEEQAQRQAEQKSALNTEAQRLLSSGNTQEIAAFSIANPDYGKAIREQIKFASDETDANMMSGMQQIISGADPEQVLNDRATFVESQGGDATQTRQEIQRFREDPEGYVKQMEGLYAFMDPKGSDAFQSSQGRGPSAVSPSNVREYEYYTSLDDAGKRDFLTMKRASQGFQQGDVQMTQDPTNPRLASPVIEQGQGQGTQASMQETATKQVATKAASVKAAEQSIAQSDKLFERLGKLTSAESNINEAIRLVDAGAETGPVISMLPSVTKASVELDNLQGQLGLDVIGNTTFGALSEAELKFALNTALPTKLKGPALRDWLVRKKDSQKKLKVYLEEAAIFLGTPGNTIPKFLEMRKGGGEEGAMDRKTADDFINSALST